MNQEGKRLTKESDARGAGYRTLSYRNTVITDPLFRHYVDVVAQTVLPYQWEILNDRVRGAEPSHCLDNFRIAAGEMQGKFYGVVFQDTDAYKWLEAVAYCIESGTGAELVPLADDLIELIARAQQPDGYLDTYFTVVRPEDRWTNLVEGHELYNAGHLIEAAVAYSNATGKRRILEVAARFADLIAATFGPGDHQRHGYPGHQEIELALVKLYRITRERRYLDVSRYFIEQRGKEPNYFLCELAGRQGGGIFPELNTYDLKYAQTHLPPVDQRSVEGHAVRAMYMCAAMADLALECDDDDLRNACIALWESTTNKRMYITGGVGSSGYQERFTFDYHLPNESAYCETCASVGLMMFGQRMASLTHDARYYDGVERALHNTVLAGMSGDGVRYFYVNPLEVWPDACMPATSLAHVRPVRQQWFSVSCCPTNVARTLASLGQYIYADHDGALLIHQFISSRVTTEARDGVVTLVMDADVAGSGIVRVRTDAPISLGIRIPDYAERPLFSLNGAPCEPRMERGYARFETDGPVEIVIDLHIQPSWIAANDQVRANSGKAALVLGPFVYCLEEDDNGANLAGISVHSQAVVGRGEHLVGLPGDLPKLVYEGRRTSTGVASLYGRPAYAVEPVHLTAVPYCLWCNRTPGEMLVWQKVHIP